MCQFHVRPAPLPDGVKYAFATCPGKVIAAISCARRPRHNGLKYTPITGPGTAKVLISCAHHPRPDGLQYTLVNHPGAVNFMCASSRPKMYQTKK